MRKERGPSKTWSRLCSSSSSTRWADVAPAPGPRPLAPGPCAHALNWVVHSQARSSPARRDAHAEAAFGVRIERLNQELSAKTRTIQELSRSVDRLEKEKRNAPTVSSRPTGPDKHRAEGREQPGAAGALSCGAPAAEESFPAAGYQKPYKPTVFTGAVRVPTAPSPS